MEHAAAAGEVPVIASLNCVTPGGCTDYAREMQDAGAADIDEYLLAGADVVMTASALLRHGPEHATVLLDGLSA